MSAGLERCCIDRCFESSFTTNRHVLDVFYYYIFSQEQLTKVENTTNDLEDELEQFSVKCRFNPAITLVLVFLQFEIG